MLRHLSPEPRRRPWLERIGWRRDLSEQLVLRLEPLDGDLVDETAGWVAAQAIQELELVLNADLGPVRP